MTKVAILLGSARREGNGQGIAAWISAHLSKYVPDPSSLETVIVDPLTPPHPLGPVIGALIPAQIGDPAQYPTAGVRQWSEFVTSTDAFIVVTPQYNWGYPGDLKTMFDHLYNEWKGKPIMLVTYGGHGGARCNSQLRQVFEGGLGMRFVEPAVEIKLPREYIQGEPRVDPKQPPEFLTPYEEPVLAAIAALLPPA